MEKEIIVVTMEELKNLLKKQEGEFILHVVRWYNKVVTPNRK